MPHAIQDRLRLKQPVCLRTRTTDGHLRRGMNREPVR